MQEGSVLLDRAALLVNLGTRVVLANPGVTAIPRLRAPAIVHRLHWEHLHQRQCALRVHHASQPAG